MSQENVGRVRRFFGAARGRTGGRKLKIHASAQHCYDTASDVESMQEWHPSVLSVEVLERDAAGRAQLAELAADIAGTALIWTMRFSYEPPVRLSWQGEFHMNESRGKFKGLWTFEDLGNGRTKVTHKYKPEGKTDATVREVMAIGVFNREWRVGLKNPAEALEAAGLSE